MDVLLKKLNPGRFASFYGFGKEPEQQALQEMNAWCQEQNIDLQNNQNLIYGFNNPNPNATSDEYGYEFWLLVDETKKPQNNVRIIEFNGGYYAVTECVGVQNLLQSWQSLYAWCIENKHKLGYHQALERIVGNITDINHIKIELCCPVEN